MFRSASTRQSDIAMHRLSMHMDPLVHTATNWFNGTPDSVDARLAKLDHVIGFARDTASRLGSTEAGRRAVALLPDLERNRRDLITARESLLNGFTDRVAVSTTPSGGHGAVPISPGTAVHVVPPGMDYPAGGTPGYEVGTAPVVGPDPPGVDPFPNGLGPENIVTTPPPGLTQFGDDSGLKPLPGWEPKAPTMTASAPPSLVRAVVLGSRDFVADQNTDDRDELLYRARRYAAEETSTLPVPAARQISAAFVGAVGELIARRPRKRTASRQITNYEDFEDSLLY